MTKTLIPYSKQTIDAEDIKAVIKALKSEFLTTGPMIAQFETMFAKYVGSTYAVAVSNATAGLHISVLSLDLPKGTEGITSPITFMASANAMVYGGIRPVFADIDSDTYNINPKEILNKIHTKTKLIIPVHFAGQPCEMKDISKIAKKNNLYVIEDAAHAVGSKYQNGEMVGNCKYSDLTVFSFHAVKTMTTGEGGMVTTNNRLLYERLLLLRSHGIERDEHKLTQSPGPWYHEMKLLGYNYRMTDFQAALGISQLKRIDAFIKRRREIVVYYNEKFKSIPWLTIPYQAKGVFSAFHLYPLRINFEFLGKNRAKVMYYLIKHGIGTQVHYIPVHLQPYYKQHYGFKEGDFPIAEEYYNHSLSIPLFPGLKKKDLAHIVTNILRLAQ